LNQTILLKKKDYFTIRSRDNITKQCYDYVLARKDLFYNVKSRVPLTTMGNLYDDLYRRDFTALQNYEQMHALP
jgi:tRNA nucleotidyltransferase/poly(A) polymerase